LKKNNYQKNYNKYLDNHLPCKDREARKLISLRVWKERQKILADQREALLAYEEVVRDIDQYAKDQENAGLPDQVGETLPSARG